MFNCKVSFTAVNLEASALNTTSDICQCFAIKKKIPPLNYFVMCIVGNVGIMQVILGWIFFFIISSCP